MNRYPLPMTQLFFRLSPNFLRPSNSFLIPVVLISIAAVSSTFALSTPRAHDLEIQFRGQPGLLNAITDVEGIEVGHTMIIKGQGKLVMGKGPVRTGVTAILPRGSRSHDDPVFSGWYSLNRNGEMTGTTWGEESGFLEGSVMITNTHSVGVGTVVQDGSGDIFIAFSTHNSGSAFPDKQATVKVLPNWAMNPLFEATVQATQESIINALVAAEDMTGINENTVYAPPHDRLKDILKQYNRLND